MLVAYGCELKKCVYMREVYNIKCCIECFVVDIKQRVTYWHKCTLYASKGTAIPKGCVLHII